MPTTAARLGRWKQAIQIATSIEEKEEEEGEQQQQQQQQQQQPPPPSPIIKGSTPAEPLLTTAASPLVSGKPQEPCAQSSIGVCSLLSLLLFKGCNKRLLFFLKKKKSSNIDKEGGGRHDNVTRLKRSNSVSPVATGGSSRKHSACMCLDLDLLTWPIDGLALIVNIRLCKLSVV